MSETDGLPTAQRRWVMACVLGGFTLTNLDGAIANIALPTLAREFSASASATIWVVNIYQLAMAVCLLPAAALGGTFGLKRVYAFGLILFTLASAACALATSLDLLVAARAVQGIGGACVSGLGPALVRVIYPRKLMGQGLGQVALVIALSGVLGPTVAAGILSVASWPWLFLVNVPVCLIAAPVFMSMAPSTPGDRRAFDFAFAKVAGDRHLRAVDPLALPCIHSPASRRSYSSGSRFPSQRGTRRTTDGYTLKAGEDPV